MTGQEAPPPLRLKDFELAQNTIGKPPAHLSREEFSRRHGYPEALIRDNFTEAGDLTAAGKEALRRAIDRVASREAAPMSPPTDIHDPSIMVVSPPPGDAHAQVHALALQRGVSVEVRTWREARTLGTRGGPYIGDIALFRNHWAVRSTRGGRYRITPGPNAALHAVNVLMLKNIGQTILADHYAMSGPNRRGEITLKPQPWALSPMALAAPR